MQLNWNNEYFVDYSNLWFSPYTTLDWKHVNEKSSTVGLLVWQYYNIYFRYPLRGAFIRDWVGYPWHRLNWLTIDMAGGLSIRKLRGILKLFS